MTDLLRWGIASTGKISNSMAEALASIDGVDVVAVGSRSPASADDFAATHSIAAGARFVRSAVGGPRCRRGLHRLAPQRAPLDDAGCAGARQARVVREGVCAQRRRGARDDRCGSTERPVPDGSDVELVHARMARPAGPHRRWRDRRGHQRRRQLRALPSTTRTADTDGPTWRAARSSTSASIHSRSAGSCWARPSR